MTPDETTQKPSESDKLPTSEENSREEQSITGEQENTSEVQSDEEIASSGNSASISADLQNMLDKFEQRMKDRAAEEDEREQASQKESPIERLERELREKDALLRKYIAGHKEAVVQFEQSRNRLQKDVKNQVKLYTRKFLEDLLDVVDNLDRALESYEKDPNAEGFFEGVAMVRTQFLQKLKKNDVERMESLHTSFDPLLHEAISTVPVEDEALNGTVVGIVKEGYTIGEDILRPATVAVGKINRS